MKRLKEIILTSIILLLGMGLFTSSTEASTQFKDLSSDYWAFPDIVDLSERGIITGFSDGTFRPQQPVTRAQSAIFMGRALNLDTTKSPSSIFSDVTPKTSGYEYINALVEEGVFSKAQRFNPSNSITCAQMAKILVEAFDLEGAISKSFSDVGSDHWAKGYINTLVATGITQGTSETTFSPNAPVSRVQMAVFIKRTLDYKEHGQASASNEYSDIALEMLELVNAARMEHGVKPLELSPNLQKAANFRAEDMIKNKYYEHISPVYGHWINALDRFGVKYVNAGENIAAAHLDPKMAFNAWMDSPGHRDNILAPYYTHIGVGYAEGDYIYSPVWVQMFIGPKGR